MVDAGLTFEERMSKWLSFNRLGRMRQHYVAICDELKPKSAKDKKEVAFFTAQFDRYGKHVEVLWRIKLVFWAVLYATIFVGILTVVSKFLPFLQIITAFLQLGSAIFGPISFFAVLYLTARINLNLELMQDCMTHLICIYHKNEKRDTDVALGKIAKAI